jgi:hypothetical protein
MNYDEINIQDLEGPAPKKSEQSIRFEQGSGSHELVAQAAHGEKQLRVSRVEFNPGSQSTDQVFDLIVENTTCFIFRPYTMTNVIL